MTELGKMQPLALDAARAAAASPMQRVLIILAVFIVFTAAIAISAGGYWLSNFTQAYATILAVTGCALLYGQLGLVSLCQWALVGVGGWATLRIYHAFHPPFEIAIFAGGIAAAAIGMIWGLPALRMRGLYLALVTLMLAGAFTALISVTSFPVGGAGFLGTVGASGNDRLMMARPSYAASDTGYFIYVAIVTFLGVLLAEAHRHSKPGRAWALIRKNEHMAAASGVRIVFYKAWAFGLSGFLAGVGGGLLAGAFGQLDASAFAPADSIVLFIGTLLGGTGVWLGPFLGGLLTRAIPALLNDYGVNNYVGLLVFGIALIQALTVAPEGLGGQLTALAQRLAKKFAARRA